MEVSFTKNGVEKNPVASNSSPLVSDFMPNANLFPGISTFSKKIIIFPLLNPLPPPLLDNQIFELTRRTYKVGGKIKDKVIRNRRSDFFIVPYLYT